MAVSKDKTRMIVTLSKEMMNHLTLLSRSFTDKGLEVHTKSQIIEEALRLYIIFLSERVNEEMKEEAKKEESSHDN